MLRKVAAQRAFRVATVMPVRAQAPTTWLRTAGTICFQYDFALSTLRSRQASVNARTGLGFDNIVSLRGINYNGSGGGNWMGIDYVQLNHEQVAQLQFQAPTVSGGQITLNWTGSGALESAPTITGPWTEIPAATTPYSEAVVNGQMRFYRLRSP